MNLELNDTGEVYLNKEIYQAIPVNMIVKGGEFKSEFENEIYVADVTMLNIEKTQTNSMTTLPDNFYKEGTFTPQLKDQAPTGATYNITSHGSYKRVGNLVMFNIQIAGTTTGTPLGTLSVEGLPFPVHSTSFYSLQISRFTGTNVDASVINNLSAVLATDAKIYFGNLLSTQNLQAVNFNGNISITGIYETNAYTL